MAAERSLATDVVNVIDKALKTLDPDTRKMAADYLKQFPHEQQLAAIDELVQMTWAQTPVPIREFVLGDAYLNLKNVDGTPEIYGMLMDDLEELFSGSYIEAVLTGGIGWGKSAFARLCHCYMLHQLGCLVNPAKAYGLQTGSRIVLINLAIHKKNAEQVVFQQVQTMVDNSRWFTRHMPRKRERLDHIEFHNGVWLAPFAANEKAVVGFDAFGGVMDEVNEMAYAFESTRKMRGEIVFDQAQRLRDALVRRMKSRFEQVGLTLPGILVQISSSKYPGEYTERRIKEAKDGDTSIFWRQYAMWETNRGKYSPTTFRLALGTKVSAPFVVQTEDDRRKIEDCKPEVIDVPDDLENEFRKDIHSAIRDFIGRSTAAITPFIARVEKVFEAFQRGKHAGLEHPFKFEYSTLSEEDGLLWDVWSKKFDPTIEYFAHGDLAKHKLGQGDRAGIAIGHIAGKKLIVRANKLGEEVQMVAPHYVIDFVVQVISPPNDEIRISWVKGFFKELKSYGMRFASITFDQWQSLSLIQDLTEDFVAFEVEEFSVDRTGEPYQEYKDALYEDRIDMYEHSIVQAETTALEKNEKTGKVDHPPNGSKDCTDAIAAICYKMLQHTPMEKPVMVQSHTTLAHDPLVDTIDDIRIRKAAELDLDPAAVVVTFDDILFSDAYLDD